MKVRFTEEALKDLDDIAAFLRANYPGLAPVIERRIRAVVARVARWPASARRTAGRPAVRVAPLGRYPYKVFYRVREDAVEILHVHHAAREPWDQEA
jgi:toxin ParE1/3/4